LEWTVGNLFVVVFLAQASMGLEAFLEQPDFFCQIVLAGTNGEKMRLSGRSERVSDFSLARE